MPNTQMPENSTDSKTVPPSAPNGGTDTIDAKSEASAAEPQVVEKVPDIEETKLLYQLWIADNNMLNVKLTQFVTVTALLVASQTYFQEASGQTVSWFGLALSVLWLFSLNRTAVHRNYWKRSIEKSSRNVLPSASELGWWGRLGSGVPAWMVPGLAIAFWVGRFWLGG